MTVRELFDFVTDPNITDENIEAYLEKVISLVTVCAMNPQFCFNFPAEHVIKSLWNGVHSILERLMYCRNA